MRLVSKSLILKAGIVSIATIAGATAIYAWQSPTDRAASKPVVGAGKNFVYMWDLHNNAHMDNLPVQAIEGRD